MSTSIRKQVDELSDEIRKALQRKYKPKDLEKIDALKLEREKQKHVNRQHGAIKGHIYRKMQKEETPVREKIRLQKEYNKIWKYDLKIIDNKVAGILGEKFYFTVRGRAGEAKQGGKSEYKVYSDTIAKYDNPGLYILKKERNKFKSLLKQAKDPYRRVAINTQIQRLSSSIQFIQTGELPTKETFLNITRVKDGFELDMLQGQIAKKEGVFKIKSITENKDGSYDVETESEKEAEKYLITFMIVGNIIDLFY